MKQELVRDWMTRDVTLYRFGATLWIDQTYGAANSANPRRSIREKYPCET